MRIRLDLEHRTITVRTLAQPHTLEGWVSGPFAIHPEVCTGEGCTVSHLKSGHSVLPEGITVDFTQGCELIQSLLDAGLDWDFADPDEMPEHTGRGAAIVLGQFLRRHQLAIQSVRPKPLLRPGMTK